MKRACAILLLLVLVVVASSCNKTPEPTPEPEPTHHYPETIYVPFEFRPAIVEANPNMDTIKFYADKPDVKTIIMDLQPMDTTFTFGWGWRAFDKARDTLQSRIDIAPDKVCGRGTIFVKDVIPDSLHNIPGLPRGDSIAFSNMGFKIYLVGRSY